MYFLVIKIPLYVTVVAQTTKLLPFWTNDLVVIGNYNALSALQFFAGEFALTYRLSCPYALKVWLMMAE